jgi:hypothetical protein
MKKGNIGSTFESFLEDERIRLDPPALYWISFVREEAFNGACIVEAIDSRSALARAAALGINPGGDAFTARIEREQCDPEMYAAAREHQNRLFKREEEIEALFGLLGSANDAAARGIDISFACEKHSRPS